MVYCTCNDFDGESLEKSIKQTYPHFDVVILDDSTEEAYKEKINAFALHHGIKVVRRKDRQGFRRAISTIIFNRKNAGVRATITT